MKITEVSVQKNNKDRANVYLDGKYVLSLDLADAVLLGIKPGREIDDKELKNLLFESQLSKSREKALAILSRKSLSEKMLYDELIKKGYDDIVIDVLIDDLKELGYIDDYAYTLLFLESCREKVWGRKKAEYELKQNGIDTNTFEDALCEISLPDEEDICRVISCKYPGEDAEDFKVKQKIMRYFVSRGFEFQEVEKGINLYLKKD